MKKLFTFIMVFSLVSVSVIAQTKEEKKALKKEKNAQEYAQIKELLQARNFEFTADWATTQRGKRISLTTNTNFVKFENDSVNLFLPYFGIAHNAGYGSGGGLEFEGTPEDYSLTFDDKKQKGVIKFKVRTENGENLTFNINVFKGGSTSINVNSSNRNSINYSGKTKKLEKNK